MKPVRALGGPTPGLSAYLAEEADGADWGGFRAHRRGESYRELIDALADRQHGLCGYCETAVAAGCRQVEHVVPRSDSRRGAARELDVGNMMACCLGGTRPDAGDSAYYLPPPRANVSCGQKKGDGAIADFVDPRTLPEAPSLMRVKSNGVVETDRDACATAGRPAGGVDATIEFLGLNVERLRRAREKRWLALEDAWGRHRGDKGAMRGAAREELLPDDGRLRRFSTTSRSYFAEWEGEEVLAEDPGAWI